MTNNAPKYEIVKNYILSQIKAGIYQPHQIIESELELSNNLSVSRITVRRGIEELVNEKILSKKKGIGTFVNPIPKFFGFKAGIGFTSEVKNRGMEPSTKLLKLEKVKANAVQAEDMKIAAGEELWLVERIRYADKVAVIYEIEYFDASIVKDLNVEICENSIYEYLNEQGVSYEFIDQRISATLADSKIAEFLDVEEGAPLIDTKIIACMKNGKPFNLGFALYQTKNYYLMHTIYK
ncbi:MULTISPECIES: GntR family transcriptional regulator [Oceanobacillus]|uniref:GntR family transcriptional regulator n=1 Tax=Oceanobacillus TaxID=182709 RepID=UPI002115ECC6|nr:GntR family transcriptional regulator [Oceanobacillus oncorhynchi]UUI38033.1 GntR family transcriptional regulator [Oceanobacillus oncorhynchi]